MILRGLRAYPPQTVTSADRFRRALAVTRLTGVAITRGELEPDACGIAMPVFGPAGTVLAAIELTTVLLVTAWRAGSVIRYPAVLRGVRMASATSAGSTAPRW